MGNLSIHHERKHFPAMKPLRIKHGGIYYRWYLHPWCKPAIAIFLQSVLILLLIAANIQLLSLRSWVESYEQAIDVCLQAGNNPKGNGVVQFGNYVFLCKMEFLTEGK